MTRSIKWTKLDSYDYELKFDDYKLVGIVVKKLTEGDVISIINDFNANSHHIYVDSYKCIENDYRIVRPKKTRGNSHSVTLIIYVDEIRMVNQ